MLRPFSFAFVAFAASAKALNLTVSSSGGNATSPLQYGIMFEVCYTSCSQEKPILILVGHQLLWRRWHIRRACP